LNTTDLTNVRSIYNALNWRETWYLPLREPSKIWNLLSSRARKKGSAPRN